jgi:3-oxoacyl-[acyl-carrier-protein] synthase II
MDRGVVVTGIGVLSPIGIGRGRFTEGLLRGEPGFGGISLFDATPYSVRTAGEVRGFDPVQFLGKKGLRTLDRSTRLLSAAAVLALEDARLSLTEADAASTGVAVGTTFGSLHSISQFDREGLTEGPRYVNPSFFPNTVINSPASQVSIRLKIKGFNTTISTGFCSGLDALSYARDFIRLGRAEVVLAGAVEELCEETFRGFHDLGWLSGGGGGSEPLSCPFDARRDGIVLSEGATVLILEELSHALERGADILAAVRGCGSSFEPSANGSFRHGGRGLGDAISKALGEAKASPEDIGFISAGANSTRGLDRLEAGVINGLFGQGAVPVSATKSMLGESFSAGGGLSLAAAACSIKGGFIPPTAGYRERDPGCDLDVVTEARRQELDAALLIASDPYGFNSAVVLGGPGGAR